MLVIGTSISVFESTVSGVISRSYSRTARRDVERIVVKIGKIGKVSLLRAQLFNSGVCISVRVSTSKAVPLSRTRSVTRGIRRDVRGGFGGMGRYVIRIGPIGRWVGDRAIQDVV